MSIDMAPEGTEAVEWDWSKVVPGETVEVPAPDGDEDIAPGVIEVVPLREPVLYRGGSAAMVVAARTGRAVGLSTRYLGVGTKHTCILGWRYLRAHDHQEVLGGMSSGADWNKVSQTRKARWKLLGWCSAAVSALDLAGWWALVKYAGMTALDYSWAILPGTEALATVAAVALYGRYRVQNPGIPAGQILADDDIDDGEEPFPLAWCKDGNQVEECVSRALAAEGIGTRSVRCLGHQQFGWEIDIVLKGSKVAKVAAAADDLDSHFNIKTGGTLIDPDPQEAAHLILRLITANPFANMPKPTVHAPNSLDITEPHNLAWCMDGSPLNLVLEGLRILLIGVSGAAKSTGAMRDLAEVITACHNAIALDLDPVKDGLREFEGVMAAPPIRGNKECEKWLDYLVAMAEARNGVRNRLKMGDTWVATRTHPAIFPFVDEFIYLSPTAKDTFIKLLRLGKQTGIYPIAAGQDATSDAMGDAIADSFTLRVMLPARWDDIRIVFGKGAAAEGFRPDRLVPAQNKDIKNDAGQSYIKGPGLTRPLLYGWNELSRSQIDRAVADRAEAGRPWFDDDTLQAAGLLKLKAQYGPASTAAGGGSIVKDAAAVLLNLDVDRMRPETLTAALAEAHPDRYAELTVDELKVRLRDAGVGAPVPLGEIDGLKNPRGYKLSALTGD
ncbi:hypothetical protein [Streptomyces sp. NPDC007063]|uniref:hypothetical protein n=1 Tax=Streptomyces sp. NPDC007063 TaxID=3364772 RepID=UPI003698AA54